MTTKQEWWQVVALILCGIAAIGWLLFSIFGPEKSNEVTFNVVGVANATSANVSTLVQIHFECIKYCSAYSSYTQICWEQCATLGNEGCDNMLRKEENAL